MRLLGKVLVIIFFLSLSSPIRATDFQEGDIVFQAVKTSQTLALYMATGSVYTHCGIVYQENGEFYVFEALNVMSKTPIEEWINRSLVPVLQYRLKDSRILTPEVILAMKKAGLELADKSYDYYFQWSDQLIYCSELVYKVYQRGAGLELVPLKRFQDYDLSHPAVQALIKKRFPEGLPLEEKAVAPADIIKSPFLALVAQIPVEAKKQVP
jgi:hypothetical protein